MQPDEAHKHHIEIHENASRAFLLSIILNLVYVFVEFGYGFYENSLALMSDAGHNLTDVANLALGLFAIKLAQIKPNKIYTYGYSKASVLISLINAVTLLITVGVIGYNAFDRFTNPHELNGFTISFVAGIGIIINSVSAFLFFKNKEHDINNKGAFLHLLADALVSLSVVFAGIIIHYTHWYIIDPLLSLMVMVFIVISTWKILSQSLRLTLDAVPENVNVKALIDAVEKQEGVVNFHHLHVWPLSTTKNALTGHLLLNKDCDIRQAEILKIKTKELLLQYNIHHATIETEYQLQNQEL